MLGYRRGEKEHRNPATNRDVEIFLDLITDLLAGLNYFKINMSYETLMSCTFDELDYWILRANQLIEDEKARQEEESE